MSYDYSNFIIMMAIIIGMFIYINKEWKKNKKVANRKLRYGIVISSITIALPCTFILEPPFLVNEFQKIFGLSGEEVYQIFVIISSVLFIVVIKFIYVPINKD